MEISEEAVYLPLDKAIEFLNEHHMFDVINKINSVEAKLKGSRQSRNIRKGIVVDELEKNGLFNSFCDKYWKNGFSSTGIKAIRKYKNHLNILVEDFEESEVSEMIEQGILQQGNIDESSFAYEDDLRDYLVNNLQIIEQGLTLFKDEKGIEGVEYSVDVNNKRIDILAIDKNKIPVVIELKVSKGYEKVIGQSQYYKNRIKKLLNTDKVRIVIIAREITDHLKIAIEDLPFIELFEYELKFSLKKVN